MEKQMSNVIDFKSKDTIKAELVEELLEEDLLPDFIKGYMPFMCGCTNDHSTYMIGFEDGVLIMTCMDCEEASDLNDTVELFIDQYIDMIDEHLEDYDDE